MLDSISCTTVASSSDKNEYTRQKTSSQYLGRGLKLLENNNLEAANSIKKDSPSAIGLVNSINRYQAQPEPKQLHAVHGFFAKWLASGIDSTQSTLAARLYLDIQKRLYQASPAHSRLLHQSGIENFNDIKQDLKESNTRYEKSTRSLLKHIDRFTKNPKAKHLDKIKEKFNNWLNSNIKSIPQKHEQLAAKMLISIEQAEADLYLTPNNREFAYLIREELKKQGASQHSEHVLDIFHEYQNKPSTSNLDKLNQALTAWQKDLPAEYQRCEPVIHKLFQAIRKSDPGYPKHSSLAELHHELQAKKDNHLQDASIGQSHNKNSVNPQLLGKVDETNSQRALKKSEYVKKLEGEKRVVDLLESKHKQLVDNNRTGASEASWNKLAKLGINLQNGLPKNQGELVALVAKAYSPQYADALVELVPQLANSSDPVTVASVESLSLVLTLRDEARQRALAKAHNAISNTPFKQKTYVMPQSPLWQHGICAILRDNWMISRANKSNFWQDVGYSPKSTRDFLIQQGDWVNSDKSKKASDTLPMLDNPGRDAVMQAAVEYYSLGLSKDNTKVDARWEKKPLLTVKNSQLKEFEIWEQGYLGEHGLHSTNIIKNNGVDLSGLEKKGLYRFALGSKEGAHGMAVSIEDSAFTLFDPNSGEVTFSSLVDLKSYIYDLQKTKYKDENLYTIIESYS